MNEPMLPSESRRWHWLLVAAATGVLVWLLRPVLTPFAISIFFGYLGDPLVDWLETKRMSRTFAVFVVFFVMTALLALVVFLLLPLLGAQIGHFIDQMPAYAAWVRGTALPWIDRYTHIDFAPYFDPGELSKMLREHWAETGGVAATVFGGLSRSSLFVFELLTNIFLVPVLSFYFLRDWDVMVSQVRTLLPRPVEPTVARLARRSDEMLGGFLRGQLLVMLVLAIIYTLGLRLIGIDLALLIGLFAGLVSFVPYLGVMTGLTISLVAALVQFGDGAHVLMVLGMFAMVQMIEAFVLTPVLVGDRIGMHPVGVIFAIMAGGALFGFLGVLLALPFSAIAMVLLRYGHERYTASAMYGGVGKSALPPQAIADRDQQYDAPVQPEAPIEPPDPIA
jgi:predicted PurR-regulated permease PerM